MSAALFISKKIDALNAAVGRYVEGLLTSGVGGHDVNGDARVSEGFRKFEYGFRRSAVHRSDGRDGHQYFHGGCVDRPRPERLRHGGVGKEVGPFGMDRFQRGLAALEAGMDAAGMEAAP